MKFKIGLPKGNDNTIYEDSEWMFYYDSKGKTFISVLLGIILTFLAAFYVRYFILDKNYEFNIYNNIVTFIILIPIHEFLHLIFFPNTRNCIVGFSLKKFSFYVTTSDSFSKLRLILAIISPLIFLTILPFILLLFFKIEFLANVLLLNLIGSGSDILLLSKIIKIPKHSIISFKGTIIQIKKSV